MLSSSVDICELFLELDLYVFEIVIWPVVTVQKSCHPNRGRGGVSSKKMDDDSVDGGGLK